MDICIINTQRSLIAFLSHSNTFKLLRKAGGKGPKGGELVAQKSLQLMEIIFDIFIFIFFHLFHFNFGVTNAIRETKLRWANDYEILPEKINKINATK